ncbi:hypothetical protein C8R44DRAFT_362157 [Mycena epipterygia]|nr:hypothetical protein C8R44DRAFT_362157 [Mycena epipterygia]
MKITGPSVLPADTTAVITYTTEAGDPAKFFSRCGTFPTVPGDLGPHFIEAYNSTAVVGKDPPFAAGATYTVLPPSSTTTSTSTSTSTPTNVFTPTSTSSPTVATHITPTQNTPTQDTPSTSSPSSTPFESVFIVSPSTNSVELEAQSAITMYDSVLGATITVEGGVQSAPSGTAASTSSSSSSVSSPAKNKSISLSTIIGAAIGAVALAIIIFFLVRRGRRRQRPRPEDLVSNSPSTVDPFLSFSAQVNEKSMGSYTSRSSDSTRSSVSLLGSPTSRKGSTNSVGTLPRLRGDSSLISPETAMPGQQMEWVLRPTNDPPPGYNLSV